MTIPSLPAETVAISPEYLEVAHAYLGLQDISKVAQELDISPDLVSNILKRQEVESYINRLFMDAGYNNRTRMRELLDTLIVKKLEEMQEAGIGSNKDIMDILALSHKFTMEHLDREIALRKLDTDKPNPSNQFNVQINNNPNYNNLIERLMGNVGSQP